MSLRERLIYHFSQSPWNFYLAYIWDGIIALALFIYAFSMPFDPFIMLFTLFIGWFLFTLLEYIAHAYFLHVGRNMFVQGHAKHHKEPTGTDGLPFFTASLIDVGIFFIAIQFLPLVYAIAFCAILLASFLSFTLLHYFMHRVDFKASYLLYLQRFHYVHHLRPKKNHGVTTPIWDVVFKTYEPLKNHTARFHDDLKLKPSDKNIID